jgi:hypothetical protein
VAHSRDNARMTDSELIDRLGGISAVAELLNCSKQRVANWKRRGIPPAIRLRWLRVFGRGPGAASNGEQHGQEKGRRTVR